MSADPLPPELRQRLAALGLSATDSQRAFMAQLSRRTREPNHGKTAVDDLVEQGVDRQVAIAFFKALAEAGAGEFKAGRRGRDSRLEWSSHGAIAIATTFLDDTSLCNAAETEQKRPDSETEQPTAEPLDLAAKTFTHSFLLRPSLTVTVALPLDMTKDEANRLAEFIRAIPF